MTNTMRNWVSRKRDELKYLDDDNPPVKEVTNKERELAKDMSKHMEDIKGIDNL